MWVAYLKFHIIIFYEYKLTNVQNKNYDKYKKSNENNMLCAYIFDELKNTIPVCVLLFFCNIESLRKSYPIIYTV